MPPSARLADKNDAEALHDSRVNLRRLRGWLQAFDDRLKLKRGQRRGLRRLARATNPPGMRKICIEWLARLDTRLAPNARPGVDRFARYLSTMRNHNYRVIRKHMPAAWHKLSRKLRRSINALQDSKRRTIEFQRALVAPLRVYALKFITTREQACGEPNAARIHRLRIAAKKLRYLLEYLLPWQPATGPLVRELRVLHETAGAIQDLQRFRSLSEQAFLHQAGARYRRLLSLFADPGADQRSLRHPDLTPGLMPLLWISRAAGIRQAQYLARFKRAYLGKSSRRACCIRANSWYTACTRINSAAKPPS